MSDDIRRLITSHFSGDDEDFIAAAWDLVKRERRLNHTVLADELERVLKAANRPNGRSNNGTLFAISNGSLPVDKDDKSSLIEVAQPERELDDLILAESIRESLEQVIREFRSADILRSHGLKPANKLLFCGPPGCGKTVAAECLAKALYLPFATVRFDAVISSYLGETAANLRAVFDYARKHPIVLLFDEFDAIGKHRASKEEHGELKRVVNSFLQLLDGFHSETLTIAATNHEGLLDPALWRRFDDILLFDKPNAEEIKQLLAQLFRQVPFSSSVRLGTVSKQLNGFSFADIERMANDLIKSAILDEQDKITPAMLKAAVERQKKRRAITKGQRKTRAQKAQPRSGD